MLVIFGVTIAGQKCFAVIELPHNRPRLFSLCTFSLPLFLLLQSV